MEYFGVFVIWIMGFFLALRTEQDSRCGQLWSKNVIITRTYPPSPPCHFWKLGVLGFKFSILAVSKLHIQLLTLIFGLWLYHSVWSLIYCFVATEQGLNGVINSKKKYLKATVPETNNQEKKIVFAFLSLYLCSARRSLMPHRKLSKKTTNPFPPKIHVGLCTAEHRGWLWCDSAFCGVTIFW